jgi:hypothetical protein
MIPILLESLYPYCAYPIYLELKQKPITIIAFHIVKLNNRKPKDFFVI